MTLLAAAASSWLFPLAVGCICLLLGIFIGALMLESQLAQMVEKAKAESFEQGRKYEALQAQQRRATVHELRPRLKAVER